MTHLGILFIASSRSSIYLFIYFEVKINVEMIRFFPFLLQPSPWLLWLSLNLMSSISLIVAHAHAHTPLCIPKYINTICSVHCYLHINNFRVDHIGGKASRGLFPGKLNPTLSTPNSSDALSFSMCCYFCVQQSSTVVYNHKRTPCWHAEGDREKK